MVRLKSWLIVVVDLDKERRQPAKDRSRIRQTSHNHYPTCKPKSVSSCGFLLVPQNIRPGIVYLAIDDVRNELNPARIQVKVLQGGVMWAVILHTGPYRTIGCLSAHIVLIWLINRFRCQQHLLPSTHRRADRPAHGR